MCAIFGLVNVSKAAEVTVIGLHAMQHRAKDYTGMVSSDGKRFYRETGEGIARKVFTEKVMDRLHGRDALGHLRYPTVEDNESLDNTQPVMGQYQIRENENTWIALAHNGNLTNLPALKEIIPSWGISTSLDTEYIIHLIQTRQTGSIESDLIETFALLKGSFSLGILLPNLLIAVRDKSGNRPLSIGKLNGGYCISSETCAFPNVDAEFLQDVQPGTMVFLNADGLRTIRFAEPDEKKCGFENVYFSNPVSATFGENVDDFQFAIGKTLERLFPVPDANFAVPIPDSAKFIALGFGESRRSGRYWEPILRSHYAGRTFIAATQAQRDEEVVQKFLFNPRKINGQSVVLLDDSIVRGTTIAKIVAKLRQLGARAVHIRIGSPPVTHPCTYGINTPTFGELIAASHSVDEIRQQINADSLEFLPLAALKELSPDPTKFCYACWDGKYW